MHGLLIKIGKAFGVLKRDGFVLGSKRITKGFFAQFKKVDAGDVLIITGGVGDSARFRAENVAEELRQNGIMASTAYADNPFLLQYADAFKVFVFHRVAYTKKIEKFIEKIKAQKKEIIFDTDDLLYDSEFARGTDYFKNINPLERKLYENGLGAEIVDDPYVKVCTATTSFLADKLREKGKEVFIVKNKLSLEDLEIANRVLAQSSKVKGQRSVRIGYFSGTISHNADFATITDALLEIMKRHVNVELFLAGPLDIEHRLNKFKDRIQQLPYVQREGHFENISKADINLAPLVKDDPYCESKSELKFFEAGILGVPTVAVANRTFSEAIEDGVDGYLAGNTDEWVEALERLISSPKMREDMGIRAKEKTILNYTTKNGKNQDYYNYLRSRIASLSSLSSGKSIK